MAETKPILTCEEYVERGCCPFCGHGRIYNPSLSSYDYQVGKDSVYEEMFCRKCGKTWLDKYALVGYALKVI